nr:hypothetical protein Iba_chr06fCG8700 [Ipomoea batatas]
MAMEATVSAKPAYTAVAEEWVDPADGEELEPDGPAGGSIAGDGPSLSPETVTASFCPSLHCSSKDIVVTKLQDIYTRQEIQTAKAMEATVSATPAYTAVAEEWVDPAGGAELELDGPAGGFIAGDGPPAGRGGLALAGGPLLSLETVTASFCPSLQWAPMVQM